MRKKLAVVQAEPMVNEDVAELTSGVRSLSERVGYAVIQESHTAWPQVSVSYTYPACLSTGWRSHPLIHLTS